VGRLKQIKPLGYTSITQSLLASAKDFPEDPTARNIIIIITDGVEECPGDPCQVSEALQKKGIILRPFVVGLGTDNEAFRKQYSCAGRYFNAETPQQFQKIIGVIVNQALNNTTVQINLLDNQGLPRETDVPLTILDADNGNVVENVVHTFNGKGLPDTLYLDPIRRYRVVAHTLPPVTSDVTEVVAGRHNVIPINTPQGSLFLKMGGITRYPRLQAIVRQGNTVEIPNPGLVQLGLSKDIVGSIFQKTDGKLEWVMDIIGNNPKQLFNMQPGEYHVVYRIAGETRTLYSKTKTFKVTSGTTTQVVL